MHYEFLIHKFILFGLTQKIFPEYPYNIFSTVLGDRDIAMKKRHKNSCPHGAYILVREAFYVFYTKFT